ncbi:MAG TPA: hypothetical protein VFA59_02140 [Vicinamibacterales bacterium]|nr:hypothetical protein [Vicinamibacterales bacterium]
MPFRIAAAVVALLVAQSDRIPIRMVPVPNQTFHMRSSMDMDMDTTFDSSTPLPSGVPGSMKLRMTTIVSQTMTVGAKDDLGQITADAVIDDVQSSVSMNGAPMPAPNPMTALANKKFSVVFAPTGEIVDVSSTMPGAPQDLMKSLLSSFGQSMPVGTIGVGETIAVPLSFNLPLQMGTPGNLDGQSHMTLVSVTNGPSGRIAHFTMTMNGRMTMSGPMTAAQPGLTMTMEMNGTGTMDTNLDRGMIEAAEGHHDIVMSTSGVRGDTPVQMQMKGTLTTRQTVQ